jgi:hypothetical protein
MSTATKVRERGILFSAEMVRAILDGRKGQTRRVVKTQPQETSLDGSWARWRDAGADLWRNKEQYARDCCPYGQSGDRLWVRETWADTDETINDEPGIVYRATDPDWESMEGWKWRPSIFMPRAASRITLEITGVRVERVQEISEADAMAEGVMEIHTDEMQQAARVAASEGRKSIGPVDYFRQLWDSINAKRGFGWESNPFVWVLEFKRINN